MFSGRTRRRTAPAEVGGPQTAPWLCRPVLVPTALFGRLTTGLTGDGLGGLGGVGLALNAAPTEAHALGQGRPTGRVGRGHHRVVPWQIPFRSVILRRQVVGGPQMP